MLRQMLWEIWRSLLAVLAAVAWLVAWIALAWMLVTDPYRADLWVWGLAVVIVASHVVMVVTSPRLSLGPRLAGLSWLASVVLAGLIFLNAGGAGGAMILGYVIAAKAVVDLPDAVGLWPSRTAGEPSEPR